MPMNRIRLSLKSTLAALALSSVSAGACELIEVETPFGLRWHADCLIEEFRWQLVSAPRLRDTRLMLPDLNPSNIRFHVNGTALLIDVAVENNGTLDSSPFDIAGVAAVYAVNDPLDPNDDRPVGNAQTLMTTAHQALPAHDELTVYLGDVNLPDRSQDYRIDINVWVDPPLMGAPDGRIIESNSGNNTRGEEYVVYHQ